jgi:uncharacterized membrane protein YgcG
LGCLCERPYNAHHFFEEIFVFCVLDIRIIASVETLLFPASFSSRLVLKSEQRMAAHWRAGSAGVDLLLAEWERRLRDTPREVPHCAHGPLLLFRRWYGAGGDSKLFWVCSVSRGRARASGGGSGGGGGVGGDDCAAFCWDDRRRLSPADDVYVPWRNHGDAATESATHFCVTCQKLVTAAQTRGDSIGGTTAGPATATAAACDHDPTHESQQHRVVRCKDVKRPTELLRPLAQDTVNAQYFFSSAAVEWTVGQLNRLGVNRIVCVGTPRIHEAWLNPVVAKGTRRSGATAAGGGGGGGGGGSGSGGAHEHAHRESLLLDLDGRFAWFGRDEADDATDDVRGGAVGLTSQAKSLFSRFNMATCYFLDTATTTTPSAAASATTTTTTTTTAAGAVAAHTGDSPPTAAAAYLARAEAIVVDPPFGLPPAALGRTLRKLWAAASVDGGASGTELPTLLFFP